MIFTYQPSTFVAGSRGQEILADGTSSFKTCLAQTFLRITFLAHEGSAHIAAVKISFFQSANLTTVTWSEPHHVVHLCRLSMGSLKSVV
jgi:hypothetical protein